MYLYCLFKHRSIIWCCSGPEMRHQGNISTRCFATYSAQQKPPDLLAVAGSLRAARHTRCLYIPESSSLPSDRTWFTTWPWLRGSPWPSLCGSPWPSLLGSPWPSLRGSPWPSLRGSPGLHCVAAPGLHYMAAPCFHCVAAPGLLYVTAAGLL
jgi:hypothetical protein